MSFKGLTVGLIIAAFTVVAFNAMAEEKAPTPETVYVPGAISTEGNQAVYLTGQRHLQIMPGPDHPSGDGSQFLPYKQGTIEFFMKPTWDSVELNEGAKSFCMGRMKDLETLYYQLSYQLDKKQMFALLSELIVAEGGGKCARTYRAQTIFERGKWVHVAWTWGKRSAVYIDGKLGAQSPFVMSGPPVSPMSVLLIGYPLSVKKSNMDGMVDELRISDIERYAGDFIPPARTAEFVPDKNTRLLMHFNGNLDVQSFGSKEPAPVKMLP